MKRLKEEITLVQEKKYSPSLVNSKLKTEIIGNGNLCNNCIIVY